MDANEEIQIIFTFMNSRESYLRKLTILQMMIRVHWRSFAVVCPNLLVARWGEFGAEMFFGKSDFCREIGSGLATMFCDYRLQPFQ